MTGIVTWIAIGCGGAFAALLRVMVDKAVESHSSDRFPLGTLFVNLSGALALGVMYGLGITSTTKLILGTAVVGTYTTFSTLIFETERLCEEGDYLLATTNILGSMILGLAAAVLGWVIGQRL